MTVEALATPHRHGHRHFEGFLAEHGPLLRRLVTRLCPRELAREVDDIEQEARLRLWRALGRESGIRHPLTYLYRAARSASLDARRRARARREEPFALAAETRGPAPPPDDLAERRLLLGHARAALRALPAERRRAVALFLRGHTPAEIARLRGWREPKARSLVYRGLAELRGRLRAPGRCATVVPVGGSHHERRRTGGGGQAAP